MSGLIVLIGVTTAASCRSTATERPFDVGAAGLASLSGTWKGTLHEKKAGTCDLALRLDKRFATSQLEHKVKAEWVVEPDGSFQMRERMDDASESTEWSGAVDSSLRVTGVVAVQATCNGTEHHSLTRMAGRVVRGDAGPVLRLSCRQETCPDLGCAFDLSYELAKEK